MKQILIAMMLLILTGAGVTGAEQSASADTLVWCGLDYSKVKMIGTLDFQKRPRKKLECFFGECTGVPESFSR